MEAGAGLKEYLQTVSVAATSAGSRCCVVERCLMSLELSFASFCRSNVTADRIAYERRRPMKVKLICCT